MYVSLNWLKDFVDIPEGISPDELGQLITKKTAEIEGFVDEKTKFNNMCVGLIEKIEAHPDADSLKVCQVNVGNEVVQIVCGGDNIYEGMYCAVTLPGSMVRWHGEGELVEIKKTKLRGVESYGMIAAASELDLPDENETEHGVMDIKNAPQPGTPLSEYFEKDDIIFEFDNKSLTHRPDLWGHYGIARELAALLNTKLKPFTPKVEIPTSGETVDVDIQDQSLCPRYVGLRISGVKVAPSPQWLADRLKAIDHGLYNNIVDVTNYVMEEVGQPMHAFDARQINGGIIVKRAKNGEKFTDLKENEHELTDEMLVIADHKQNVALAGIIGGENSKIAEDTTDIILEAANFHPSNVRRTSVKLGVRTDSVQRFEKSLDPKNAMTAILRAAELILQICPEAKIAGPLTDINNSKDQEKTIKLSVSKTASKIGVELDAKTITELLTKLEFDVSEIDQDTLAVIVPSFRATKDVNIADDLTEEVARLYGYDNIPAVIPTLPARLPSENHTRKSEHKLRKILSYGLGYTESYNYSFYGKKELENCLIPDENHVLLQNYLSEDQTHMRISMIPNLVKNLQENIKHFESFKIYELGHTYTEIGEFFPLEENHCTGAIVSKEKGNDNFYQAVKAVETIFSELKLANFKIQKGIEAAPFAHPNKADTFMNQKGQTLAKLFVLHPSVAKNHNLENHQVAIFDINLTTVLEQPKKTVKYKTINRYPSIDLDISVVIDSDVEVGTLLSAIQKASKQLISNVALFDIYEGEHVEAGKKAVAFKVTLQAADRTLTDNDMAEVQTNIFKNLEKLGGFIRGKK